MQATQARRRAEIKRVFFIFFLRDFLENLSGFLIIFIQLKVLLLELNKALPTILIKEIKLYFDSIIRSILIASVHTIIWVNFQK